TLPIRYSKTDSATLKLKKLLSSEAIPTTSAWRLRFTVICGKWLFVALRKNSVIGSMVKLYQCGRQNPDYGKLQCLLKIIQIYSINMVSAISKPEIRSWNGEQTVLLFLMRKKMYSTHYLITISGLKVIKCTMLPGWQFLCFPSAVPVDME